MTPDRRRHRIRGLWWRVARSWRWQEWTMRDQQAYRLEVAYWRQRRGRAT